MSDKVVLINGDCLIEMQSIPDKAIDMILCDLPYGTTACKWDVIIPFDKLWEQYERIIKDNGAIVLFGSEPFSSLLCCSNIKLFKYDWVWIKENATGHLNAHRMPMKLTENILIFSKGGTIYSPQGLVPFNKKVRRGSNGDNYGKSGTENVQDFTNYPLDVLCFSRDKDKLHPTQKPVALLEYLIKTYTNEGDVVLDNTMGSGSTGVACVNTNRLFIGIEKEQKYYDIAVKRIDEALALEQEKKVS